MRGSPSRARGRLSAASLALLLMTAGCGGDNASVTATATATATDAEADGDVAVEATPTVTPQPRSTLTDGAGGRSGGLTAAATATPAQTPKPSPEAADPTGPDADPVAAGDVDPCAVLVTALTQTIGGPPDEPSGDEDSCFIFGDQTVVLFLYPAAAFDEEAAAPRGTEGQPFDGVGERALLFSGMESGASDGLLVQAGNHAFLLIVGGVDHDTTVATAQAVIDALP